MTSISENCTQKSCYYDICDWTTDSTSPPPTMPEIIHRYGEVAKKVNKREFARFIAELREKWRPPPPFDEEIDGGWRREGWTEEGDFALLFYVQATNFSPPKPSGPLCEAEEKGEVLLKPIESLIEEIRHAPLSAPQPLAEIAKSLAWLKAALQWRLVETCPLEHLSFELPKDFEELLHVTDYVGGAGVPSETAGTWLVGGSKGLSTSDVGTNTKWSTWFPWASVLEDENMRPLTAWKLGGCNQHRQIYYVLCRDARSDTAPVFWVIFDRDDVEMKFYRNLREFIQHETKHIEARPGGHQQEEILIYDTFSTRAW